MWDLPLGQQVSDLRGGRHIKVDAEDKRALEALGFSFGNQFFFQLWSITSL